MKNQILDSPFRESFSDFLEKGETIIWKDNAIHPKFAVTPIQHKQLGLNRNKIIILVLAAILVVIYILFYEKLASVGLSILIIAASLIFHVFSKIHHGNDIAEYALSTKRVMIKSNHSKERIIYEIPFSQLTNCVFTEKKSGRGTIFLVLKNPKEVQFETYTIADNDEVEKRHHPTLENIDDPKSVAKLIREGIKKNNT